MVKTWTVFVAIACAFPATAGAETRAWTVAKAAVPGDAKVIIGLDVAVLTKTAVWKTVYGKLAKAAQLDRIMTACKIDPQLAVQSVVLATDADQTSGAAYVAVAGLDQPKLAACLQLAATDLDPDAKVAFNKAGNIVEVTDGKRSIFYGWLARDVLVLALKPSDKASLQTWMGGKGTLGKSELGTLVVKVKTSAAVWLASIAVNQVSGAQVKHAYGWLTVATGTVNADVHAGMTDPGAATELAAMVNGQFEQAKKSSQLSPTIAVIVKQASVAAAGDEVVVRASVAETDVVALLAMALKP